MSKKKRREQLQRLYAMKKWSLVGGAVLGVVVLAIAGWYAFNYFFSPKEGSAPTAADHAKHDAAIADAKKAGELQRQAETEAKKGDSRKVAAIYDQAAASESNVTKKVQLYIDQSSVLFDAGLYDKAFEAAKKAESLSADKFLAADWLARIYEQRKDYANAAKYYEMASDWASSETNVYKITKQDYDDDAARVRALIGK